MPIKSFSERTVTFSGRKKHLQKVSWSLPRSAPPTCCAGIPGAGPEVSYLWKRQGCLPNITTTLLPAFRLVPVMVTCVPPDLGPRLGLRSERVSVCAGKDLA